MHYKRLNREDFDLACPSDNVLTDFDSFEGAKIMMDSGKNIRYRSVIETEARLTVSEFLFDMTNQVKG